MTTVPCPLCGVLLAIPADAPARVICPRCLASVSTKSPISPVPMPVIPLEQQAYRDMQLSRAGIVLITLFLLAGFSTAFWVKGHGTQNPGIAMLLAVASGMAAIWVLNWPRELARRRSSPRPTIPVDRRQQDEGHRVLDYRSPPPKPARLHGRPVSVDRQVALFVLGTVGGSAATAILLYAGGSCMLALVPAAGLVIVAVPGIRTLGAGMLFSVAIAFVIVIGLCAR